MWVPPAAIDVETYKLPKALRGHRGQNSLPHDVSASQQFCDPHHDSK
jgi:hypothetical protein